MLLSCVQLFVTQRTVVSQAPQSMEFSRPESWRGWPFPSRTDLPNKGTEPRSPTLQADSSPAEPPGTPKKTGLGGLPLLQRSFLTQKSNWRFLHWRQILYQPSYQGKYRAKVCFYHQPTILLFPPERLILSPFPPLRELPEEATMVKERGEVQKGGGENPSKTVF